MILWINLVTNGLPALALGVDPPDPTQMREPPRKRTAGSSDARDWLGIALRRRLDGGGGDRLLPAGPEATRRGRSRSHARARDRLLAPRAEPALPRVQLPLARLSRSFAMRPLICAAPRRRGRRERRHPPRRDPGALAPPRLPHLQHEHLRVGSASCFCPRRSFRRSSSSKLFQRLFSPPGRPAHAGSRCARCSAQRMQLMNYREGPRWFAACLASCLPSWASRSPHSPSSRAEAASARAKCREQRGGERNAPRRRLVGDTALAQRDRLARRGEQSVERADRRGGDRATLRFDRLDKDSPVKMDGVAPRVACANGGEEGRLGDASKTAFAVALQYDDAHVLRRRRGRDRASSFVALRDTEDHAFSIAFPVGAGRRARDVRRRALRRQARRERGGRAVRVRRETRTRGAGREDRRGARPRAVTRSRPRSRGALFPRRARRASASTARSATSTATGRTRSANRGERRRRRGPRRAPPLAPHRARAGGHRRAPRPKGLLERRPRFELVADVTGDAMKERIAVYDQFLTICGPHYRGGTEFFYRDVGGEVVNLEAREITGRGEGRLLVVGESSSSATRRGSGSRCWSILGKSDEPQTTFAHEIAVVSEGQPRDNAVHVSGRRHRGRDRAGGRLGRSRATRSPSRATSSRSSSRGAA